MKRTELTKIFMIISNWKKPSISMVYTKILSVGRVNPFNPHDALKQHFTSLKTDLIFLQPRVLERKFQWNWFLWDMFFTFPPTSSHLHPLQVENCGSNLRLVVDADDNGKFRLERVNKTTIVYNSLSWIQMRGATYVPSLLSVPSPSNKIIIFRPKCTIWRLRPL